MEIGMIWVFMAGVIVVGVGLGLWLSTKLEVTHQNVPTAMPFKRAA